MPSLFTFILITNVNKNIINIHVRTKAVYQLQLQLGSRQNNSSAKINKSRLIESTGYLGFIEVFHVYFICKLYAVHVYDVCFTSLKYTELMFIDTHAHTSVCICTCVYYTHTLFFSHGEQVVKHSQTYYGASLLLYLVYQAESSAKVKGAI